MAKKHFWNMSFTASARPQFFWRRYGMKIFPLQRWTVRLLSVIRGTDFRLLIFFLRYQLVIEALWICKVSRRVIYIKHYLDRLETANFYRPSICLWGRISPHIPMQRRCFQFTDRYIRMFSEIMGKRGKRAQAIVVSVFGNVPNNHQHI